MAAGDYASLTPVLPGAVPEQWGLDVRDSVVLRFATAAARDSALTGLGTAHEGMLAYLKDVGYITIWTGSAWDRLDDCYWVDQALQTANITSSNAGGHVETFGATAMVTATLVGGSTYRAGYSGAALGTAGDGMYARLRYKAGSTVDAAGTQLAGGIKPVSFAVTGHYVPVSVTGTFVAPSSAQYTVGVSADHYFGGANDASLYYGAGAIEPILTLERVKRA